MDNGEVIPGLNEGWTFAGAKVTEWMCGFMTIIMVSGLLDKPASWAPILVAIMVGTALTMASLRRQFPDEERGMRNAAMTAIGIAPTDIPAPSTLQPYWSGAPVRGLAEKKEFMQLGLDQVFPWFTIELDDESRG